MALRPFPFVLAALLAPVPAAAQDFALRHSTAYLAAPASEPAPLAVQAGAVTFAPGLSATTRGSMAAGGDPVLTGRLDASLGIAVRPPGIASLDATLRAGYEVPLATPGAGAGTVTLSADAALRLDIAVGTAAILSGSYAHSPGLGGAASTHDFGGALTLARGGGLLGLVVEARVGRHVATGFTGDDPAATTWGVAARADLDTGAVFQPFLEATGFRTVHDVPTDGGGLLRGSIGGAARAGVGFDAGTVTGFVAAGYAITLFDEPTAAPDAALLLAAALDWAPGPLTTLSLAADARLAPAWLTGHPLAATAGLAATLSYAVHDDVTLSANAGLTAVVDAGVLASVGASLGAGARWRIGDVVALGLTGSYALPLHGPGPAVAELALTVDVGR